MADDEIQSFLGSILSIKTKPSPEGIGSNIIGTLRLVDRANGSITLDEVVKNGEMLPNGFVLGTDDIGDLLICGKAAAPLNQQQPAIIEKISGSASVPSIKSAKEVAYRNKSVKENVTNKIHIPSSAPQTTAKTQQVPKVLQSQLKSQITVITKDAPRHNNDQVVLNFESIPSMVEFSNNSITSNGISLAGSTIMNMFAESMKQQPFLGNTDNEQNSSTSESFGLSKMDDPKVVYKASDIEQTYFTNARKSQTKSFQQILQQQNQSLKPDIQKQSTMSCNLRTPQKKELCTSSDFSPINKGAPLQNSSNGTSNTSPKKAYQHSQNRNMEAVQQQLGQVAGSSIMSTQPSARYNPGLTQQPERYLTPKHNPLPNITKQPHPNNASTFEMTNDEIQAKEFDFERNLTMFEKLPVTSKRPTKVQHNPHFTKADTTYKVARTIESIKLQGISSEKTFLTTTGVSIPSVDQNTRTSILDLAHTLGITHSRTIESMGRSVSQVCIPLLGDSFRFSPEREEDRPKVLFCAGKHWQGASCICTARILASQGVQTFVYSPKEETNICSVEERLYRLSCQPFNRDLKTFHEIDFDLIVLAIGEQLKDDLQVRKYQHFLRNKPVVLIDPPLLPSYKSLINTPGNNGSARIYIVTPTLPLPYTTETYLKVFLVNLGIPRRIYDENNVIYKSPFGDKLVIQIFSAPPSQQIQQ